MSIAESQLSPGCPVTGHDVEQPDVEPEDPGQHDRPRNISELGVVQELCGGVNELSLSGPGPQLRRGRLEQPGDEEDQEDPGVVAPAAG